LALPADHAGETAESNAKLSDLSLREMAVFAPLVVWALWIGLYPKPFFQVLERPVAQVVERVHPGYYAEQKLVNPLAPDAPPQPGVAALKPPQLLQEAFLSTNCSLAGTMAAAPTSVGYAPVRGVCGTAFGRAEQAAAEALYERQQAADRAAV